MKIPYIKTFFKAEVLEELYLPYFKGSTFRGVFGNTFKKIVCVLKNQVCNECLLKSSCIYSYIFETPFLGDKPFYNFSKYKNIPHPFVIEPPLDKKRFFKPGDELVFSVVLIGKSINYLPYFIYTFSECGNSGIGKGRGKYKLKEVYTDGQLIYNEKDRKIITPIIEYLEIEDNFLFEKSLETDGELTLHLITPLRIKSRNDLIRTLEFQTLVKHLLLRLNFLSFFHCGGEQLNWNYDSVFEIAKKNKIVEDKTYWWDWERYSSRQNTKIKLGGIVGEIRYCGIIEPFKSLLKAGEILHVGKNTSFGLGKYIIVNGV